MFVVSEETATADDLGNLRWDHLVPGFVRALLWSMSQRRRWVPPGPRSSGRDSLRVQTAHSGLTCRSTSGLTEISPLNGRSWLAISTTDTATPVAKIPIAIAAAARLSQRTIAIAISVQPACANRQVHFTQFTLDRLRTCAAGERPSHFRVPFAQGARES